MKRRILHPFLLTVGVFWFVFCCTNFCFAQGPAVNEGIPPPPVEVQFSLVNAPSVGADTLLKVKVKALEDIHVDISCLLPEGIEPIQERGVTVRPYEDVGGILGQQYQTIYAEALELWVGLLKSGTTQEFVFRVKIPDKKKYDLIARIEALAKWGVREEVLAVTAI